MSPSAVVPARKKEIKNLGIHTGTDRDSQHSSSGARVSNKDNFQRAFNGNYFRSKRRRMALQESHGRKKEKKVMCVASEKAFPDSGSFYSRSTIKCNKCLLYKSNKSYAFNNIH